MAIAIFVVFFILIFLNIPIAVALGLAAAFGLYSLGLPLSVIPNLMYSGIAKFVLVAIPYFVLAGVIMNYVGISQRLVNFASAWVGHVRHGMIVVLMVATCFFSSICGSGPATVAALGPILIPAMIAAGYNPAHSTALMSSAGGLGIIIPPSIAFVVYSSITDVSISGIFSGGIMPGLIVAVFFLIAGIMGSWRDGGQIKKQAKASGKERWNATKDAFWGILAPVIILGGIYGGIFTATEAAGVAIVYSIFVGVAVYRDIKLKDMFNIFVESAITSATVMFIIACASIFAWLMMTSHIATDMSDAFMSIAHNKIVMLLIANIIFLIAGAFLDANSAMYIIVPLMIPVIKAMGIDLIHFGVIITVNLALGQVTPPVGINLFVGCNIAKLRVAAVFARIWPFVGWGIVALMIVTYVPWFTMFLAHLTMR